MREEPQHSVHPQRCRLNPLFHSLTLRLFHFDVHRPLPHHGPLPPPRPPRDRHPPSLPRTLLPTLAQLHTSRFSNTLRALCTPPLSSDLDPAGLDPPPNPLQNKAVLNTGAAQGIG